MDDNVDEQNRRGMMKTTEGR